MRILLITILITVSSCFKNDNDGLVLVKGGSFKYKKSEYYSKNVKMPDFYLGKYEVTQKEWVDVMGFNPSAAKGGNMPVESVNWYDCAEYCNKLSEKKGFKPCYKIYKDKKDPQNNNEYDEFKWVVTINKGANGYHLPTDEEWEYAATGGQLSKNYKYIGSDDIYKVTWFWENSGDVALSGIWSLGAVEGNHNKPKPVGTKQANELGIFDMPGNVQEWCEDWHKADGTQKNAGRSCRGACWMSVEVCAEPTYKSHNCAGSRNSDMGFRVCRSM